MSANAQEEVKKRYPRAMVVRGKFGKLVVTDEDHTGRLGNGRAYWDEEAWISAVEEMEEL
jgi:hypothetical protein